MCPWGLCCRKDGSTPTMREPANCNKPRFGVDGPRRRGTAKYFEGYPVSVKDPVRQPGDKSQIFSMCEGMA